MIPVLVSTLDLARAQFATTTLYHFIFVPLTLGLAPIVAVMQTMWYRTGNEDWLRLTRFFGVLLLINFAIGVATGLVQEFEFGMNWSGYARFVGDVFGAPLAIEGLAAFFLEATFLGVWIFGWDRLSKRVHLATIWLAAAGTWLSAYFILVANSFMQHPVGYKIVDGHAEMTSVEALLTNQFAEYAFGHTILAGLTVASTLVFGISCWHLRRQRDVAVFRRSAMLALFVMVPVSIFNLGFGSHFGIITTSDQPMKIAAAEALWNTEQPAAFSLFQIGGFSKSDPTPSFSIQVPGLLSSCSTGSFDGKVVGMNQLQEEQEVAKYGSGNYYPDVELDLLEHAGDGLRAASFVALVAVVGAWLYRHRKLEAPAGWFLRVATWTIAGPVHRRPVRLDIDRTRSPTLDRAGTLEERRRGVAERGSTMLGLSLAVFVGLYVILGVTDFILMRRYARLDLPERPATPMVTLPPAPVDELLMSLPDLLVLPDHRALGRVLRARTASISAWACCSLHLGRRRPSGARWRSTRSARCGTGTRCGW